jgi:predicted amidophosphoribosyltransferase
VPTTEEVLAEWGPRLGTVPPVTKDFVCDYCLGPVNSGYTACLGCSEIFDYSNVPAELRTATVPMSSALNPSPWYNALVTYKGFQPIKGLVLASVAHHFLDTHASAIADALGAAPTIITVVPSKRGIPYEQQPLRATLSLAGPINAKLKSTLAHVVGSVIHRRTYNPLAFAPTSVDVEGERIALVEDTWVTGATAISAAGALLAFGAAAVGIYPIARVLNDNFWPPDHPYRTAMAAPYQPYDPTAWPR